MVSVEYCGKIKLGGVCFFFYLIRTFVLNSAK